VQAVGYFREAAGSSLPEESRRFLEFCKASGFEAAATFIDTKGNGEAAGYRQLLEFVRQQPQHGFILVAVSSFERLGEGATESARRYFQLASLGANVVSIEDGEDLGQQVVGQWAASRNKDGLSQRVRAAMRRKAVKGEVLGRPPYGYKVGPHRRLTIMPQEGTVVRFIFRLYLKEGLGIRRIARRLNDEGIVTRRGGQWSMVTVRDILRNRAYVGTYQRFGVRVPASHSPLISGEDFQRVQERLDQRRPANLQRDAVPFVLSSLLYCGKCGNRMVGISRRQSWLRKTDGVRQTALYRYYQCESRSSQKPCADQTRRAEQLEDQVLDMLLNRSANAAATDTQDLDAALAQAEAQVQRLRDKLRRLDRRLEQNLELASNGRVSGERFKATALSLAAEQITAEQSLAETLRLAQQQVSEAEKRRQRESALRRAQQEWDRLGPLERQETLRDLIDKVTVSGKQVRISAKR